MIRALQPGRRLDDRHARSQHRQHGPELGDLGVVLGARREVRPHGLRLGGLERAEHEGPTHLDDLVVGQHGCLIRPAHEDPPSRSRRMVSRPSRIRLLTVPSGVPVRSAISCWVNPPK